MRMTSNDIFRHFKNHRVVRNGLSKQDCEQIMYWVDKNNYLQILYDYQINVLLVLLELFEQEDMYEECSALLNAVKDYNKVSGENVKTRL